MTITKREFSQIDSAPAMMYAKRSGDSVECFPLVIGPRTQNPSGDVLQVQIGPADVISNLPVVIEYDHHQIHEGETFRLSTYTPSLAQNSVKELRLSVPIITAGTLNIAAVCPHFRFEIVTSDAALINIWEGVTATTAGTERLPINLERNGTYVSKLKVFEDSSAPTTSTMLWQGFTTVAKNNAGGIDGSANEFVLKSGTDYLFRVTSQASSNKVLTRFLWYEDLGV